MFLIRNQLEKEQQWNWGQTQFFKSCILALNVIYIYIYSGFSLKPLAGKQDGKYYTAGVQPRWIQGIRSGDGIGEDQETTA